MQLDDRAGQFTALVRDRDAKYGIMFDAVLASAGIAVKLSAPQCPKMNAHAVPPSGAGPPAAASRSSSDRPTLRTIRRRGHHRGSGARARSFLVAAPGDLHRTGRLHRWRSRVRAIRRGLACWTILGRRIGPSIPRAGARHA
jgi:hypothetical protein